MTLDQQSGGGGTTSVTAMYDEAMPSIVLPERAGYMFAGYYTAANGGGTQYYTATGASARNWDVAANTTLYAHWTANTYTVTLKKLPDEENSDTVTATFNAAMPAITKPTRTGYTFAGYYTQQFGGGTQYYTADGTSAQNWDKTSDTTLYAKWTANTYTVWLNLDSGGNGSVQATYGAPMPTPITPPTRTGYTFGGYWTSVNGGGTQYYTASGASARSWNIASNTVLYAKWTAKTYTVTLDRQSGTDGTSSVTATFNAEMSAIIPPTRTGYTFGGYYTSGNTQYYTATGASARNWDIAANTTLYAHWTAIEYTVTISAGTGGSGSDTVKYIINGGNNIGTNQAKTFTPPTRTGYRISSWTISTDYTGDAPTISGNTLTIPANTYGSFTATPTWTAKTYTVTLDRQSGTDGTSSVTATFNAAMPILSELPTRTGYTFGGYYAKRNGEGKQYYTAAGTSANNWDIANATTIYAKWTANTYNVTLKERPESDPTLVLTATYNKSLGPVTIHPREGYDFMGYFSSVGGGGFQLYDSEGKCTGPYQYTSDRTFYAYWKGKESTVTLKLRGGSGGTTSVTATYGSPMPAITLPKRAGYDFAGYFSAHDGNGTQYYTAAGASARNYANINGLELYANWTARTYAVTLNQQSGNGGTASVTATYGAAMPTLPSLPTRTGYTFGGYYTQTNGGGTQYYTAAGASARNWDRAVNITLYAHWTANTYIVTLNQRGGSGGTPSVTATFNAAMPNITKPTRTGYMFGGYWTLYDGQGSQFYDAQGKGVRPYQYSSSQTLYANWIADVTVSITAKCIGTTDNAFPSVAGVPTVKIVGYAGTSANVPAGGTVEVLVSAIEKGISFYVFEINDATGNKITPTAQKDEQGGSMKSSSFIAPVGAGEISVVAYYSRNAVTASVGVSDSSAAKVGSNVVSISPSGTSRSFGDVVTFTASDVVGYDFYGWGTEHDSVPTTPKSTDRNYETTLEEDVSLYANYAYTITVAEKSLDASGNEVVGSGNTVSVSVMGKPVSANQPFDVPIGGKMSISVLATEGYHFAGIELDGEMTDHAPGSDFTPTSSCTFHAVFKANPPTVYLACYDRKENGVDGSAGSTTASCPGVDSAVFRQVSVDDVPDRVKSVNGITNVPTGATWYAVRQGTTVVLSAVKSQENDALEWKGFEDKSLPLPATASLMGATPVPDAEQPQDVWSNKAYFIETDKIAITTWGVYERPKVTLAGSTGGRAGFLNQSPEVQEMEFEPQDGEYQTATVKAVADDGYYFAGWVRSDDTLVSTDSEYSFEVRADVTLRAQFALDDNAVFEWCGGTSNKTLDWHSGVVTVPKPGDPVSVRVDATGYPVRVGVGTYSSPDDAPTRQHSVDVLAQGARRLPRMRPERFWRIDVTASVEVDAVVASTNMAEAN